MGTNPLSLPKVVLFADNPGPIYSFLGPSSCLPESSLRETSWNGAEEEGGLVSALGEPPTQWKEQMDHKPQTAMPPRETSGPRHTFTDLCQAEWQAQRRHPVTVIILGMHLRDGSSEQRGGCGKAGVPVQQGH